MTAADAQGVFFKNKPVSLGVVHLFDVAVRRQASLALFALQRAVGAPDTSVYHYLALVQEDDVFGV